MPCMCWYDPVPFAYGALSGVLLGTTIFCVWNGRKIMKAWTDKDHKTPSVPIVSLEQDDNNPANWYLKNHNIKKL